MVSRSVVGLLLLATTDALMVHRGALPSVRKLSSTAPAARPSLKALRGGCTVASLSAAIAGPLAIPAATGIAAAAGSLAYIHQAYIFSLSYGLAMAGIGGAVLMSSATPLLRVHAALVAAYGVRLFGFLFWRQSFQPSYDGMARLKALDKTPPLKRTPIILSIAFFYALMSSPLLFHLKAAPLVGMGASTSKFGCVLAAIGLVYEAVADQQKSLFKMKLRAEGKPDELFTGGLYASSRHANYFGEITFWVGSFIAGLPALVMPGMPLTTLLRIICSGLGLSGIVFIMLSATKRLEAKQAEKYRPSAAFDEYFLSSNALLPKLR